MDSEGPRAAFGRPSLASLVVERDRESLLRVLRQTAVDLSCLGIDFRQMIAEMDKALTEAERRWIRR